MSAIFGIRLTRRSLHERQKKRVTLEHAVERQQTVINDRAAKIEANGVRAELAAARLLEEREHLMRLGLGRSSTRRPA